MKRPVLYAAVLATTLGLAACGGASDTGTVTQVTVVKEVAAPAEEQATSVAAASTAAEDPAVEEVPEVSAGRVTVPNVKGMNHQKAQDLMQSKGLYVLQEEDSTGLDRVLLWDRNWVVTGQSPRAGSRVSEDETITLRSKKYTD